MCIETAQPLYSDVTRVKRQYAHQYVSYTIYNELSSSTYIIYTIWRFY